MHRASIGADGMIAVCPDRQPIAIQRHSKTKEVAIRQRRHASCTGSRCEALLVDKARKVRPYTSKEMHCASICATGVVQWRANRHAVAVQCDCRAELVAISQSGHTGRT